MLLLPIDMKDCTGQRTLGSTVSTIVGLLGQAPPSSLGAIADTDTGPEPEQEGGDDRESGAEERQADAP
jgi:hypothetical protein